MLVMLSNSNPFKRERKKKHVLGHHLCFGSHFCTLVHTKHHNHVQELFSKPAMPIYRNNVIVYNLKTNKKEWKQMENISKF